MFGVWAVKCQLIRIDQAKPVSWSQHDFGASLCAATPQWTQPSEQSPNYTLWFETRKHPAQKVRVNCPAYEACLTVIVSRVQSSRSSTSVRLVTKDRQYTPISNHASIDHLRSYLGFRERSWSRSLISSIDKLQVFRCDWHVVSWVHSRRIVPGLAFVPGVIGV